MILGIDPLTHLVYEGFSHTNGHGIIPSPVVSPAAHVIDKNNPLSGLSESPIIDLNVPLVFREDAFDPVTRIRRGRLYRRGEKTRWIVSRHPLGSIDPNHGPEFPASTKELQSFEATHFPDEPQSQRTIVLGSKRAPTFWTVVGVETISTGEDLITLRARTSFGALPELRIDQIPAKERTVISSKLEKLTDEVYRAGADSVVDHCRESTTAILSARLREVLPDSLGLDLGGLIKVFEGNESLKHHQNVINIAKTISRFHPRRKTSEQEKRDLRPIHEQDAQLAVLGVGSVLCDLGWAEWVYA